MNGTYEYLYKIGTTGMTIVLGLLIGRIAKSIVYLFGKPFREFSDILIVSININITILLMLLSIIGTISYAHSELKIPYRPIYFLIAILLICLPLYISVETLYRAIPFEQEDVKNVSFNPEIFSYGMGFLFVTFISLLLYLILIYAKDNIVSGESRLISTKDILRILPFHIGGILFAFASMMVKDVLFLKLFSIAALFASVIYLVFVWAMKVQLKAN